jgi:hypothetical protein
MDYETVTPILSRPSKELPKEINVIRAVTYSVPNIIDDLIEQGYQNITTETIMGYIEDWVAEDFCGHTTGLSYQDQNGKEITHEY